jgi:hypothetical protein
MDRIARSLRDQRRAGRLATGLFSGLFALSAGFYASELTNQFFSFDPIFNPKNQISRLGWVQNLGFGVHSLPTLEEIEVSQSSAQQMDEVSDAPQVNAQELAELSANKLRKKLRRVRQSITVPNWEPSAIESIEPVSVEAAPLVENTAVEKPPLLQLIDIQKAALEISVDAIDPSEVETETLGITLSQPFDQIVLATQVGVELESSFLATQESGNNRSPQRPKVLKFRVAQGNSPKQAPSEAHVVLPLTEEPKKSATLPVSVSQSITAISSQQRIQDVVSVEATKDTLVESQSSTRHQITLPTSTGSKISVTIQTPDEVSNHQDQSVETVREQSDPSFNSDLQSSPSPTSRRMINGILVQKAPDRNVDTENQPIALNSQPSMNAPIALLGPITQERLKVEYLGSHSENLVSSPSVVDIHGQAQLRKEDVLAMNKLPNKFRKGKVSADQFLNCQDLSNSQSKKITVSNVLSETIQAPSDAELLSWEGGVQSQQCWLQSSAAGYRPTVSFLKGSKSQLVDTYLLLENDLQAFATLNKITLQKSTSVILVASSLNKKPRISSRHEEVIEHQRDNIKYSIFLNVPPGPVLVDLGDGAGVAAPAISGSTTYLNLTESRQVLVSGQVQDAASSEGIAVADARVQLIGSSNQSAFTTRTGKFNLGTYTVYGNYDVYFQVDLRGGFTHRLRYPQDALKHVTLYTFGSQKIQSWTSQLEGGVSPESGMIVAAMPEVIEQRQNTPLYGSIESKGETHSGGAGLIPEIYSLDIDDTLSERHAVHRESPRLVGVQIPEGLQQLSLKDRKGRTYWSEFVVSSPGVVNVIGPR